MDSDCSYQRQTRGSSSDDPPQNNAGNNMHRDSRSERRRRRDNRRPEKGSSQKSSDPRQSPPPGDRRSGRSRPEPPNAEAGPRETRHSSRSRSESPRSAHSPDARRSRTKRRRQNRSPIDERGDHSQGGRLIGQAQRTRQGRRRRRKRRRRQGHNESSAENDRSSKDERSPVPRKKGNLISDDEKVRASTRSPSTHDDTIGHFRGEQGTIIADRFRIIRDVGIGTFGRVVECFDLDSRLSRGRDRSRRGEGRDYVAIKIVRNVKRYYESALVEARIIDDVNRRGGRGMSHCVILQESFTFQKHYCMVFERLGPSLYDFLKRHEYQPFPLKCVQDFAVQLLETLEFLHSFRLIHTDLKIENILLMNDREVTYANQRLPESTRIKLIDFGGACYDSDKKSSIINTRQYRAPEVILGIGWSMPSDMWSLGCILAELLLGELLFATHDNLEHLALIERTISSFPMWMLKKARSNSRSQLADEAFSTRGYHRMQEVLPAESASFVNSSPPLGSLFRRQEDAWFLDLLRKILVIDPYERATAYECLQFLSRIGRNVVRYC